MACKTETKMIGEREYSVTQWPADKAILMKFRLVKVAGSALAVLASGADEPEALEHSIQAAFSNSSPEDMAKLLKDVVLGASCDGKVITESYFTEIFSGDMLFDVYKVFAFVIQTNYSQLGKLLTGQVKERFLSPITD